jgi:NAD(P)-dependent dehydrogenase (short-subunit alcohol dehydrogenase family)
MRWNSHDYDPSEIAGVALFLASPMAKFMSGSIVTVDAGQTSH